eukprot:TRINITY_DN11770_c0_g1_i1.p1 TRINITY_DN11770_c0_g1~~TRINITY_DN11770_c0_g1_i1.p1  ORF type:complete len:294 (-),score=65.52 TRINITY_DN11770_c0_g1_i1:409-1290(-)
MANYDQLLEKNPNITYTQLRQALLDEGASSEPQPITEDHHTELYTRLETMTQNNPYHNEQHSRDVHDRVSQLLNNLRNDQLFTDRQKVLIKEAALRHDDDHIGNGLRQTVDHGFLSNEEVSAARALDELKTVLTLEELIFVEAMILATTFGQSHAVLEKKFPDDVELREKLRREYGPVTPAEKLLCLADIGGFMSGWDYWSQDGHHLCIEGRMFYPDVDSWIDARLWFIRDHVRDECLAEAKEYLTDEYFGRVNDMAQVIIDRVLSFKEGEGRKEFIPMFDAWKDDFNSRIGR